MEVGAVYNKQKLHGQRYFDELLDNLDYVPESVMDLLRLCRTNTTHFVQMQKQLVKGLIAHPDISKRTKLLIQVFVK